MSGVVICVLLHVVSAGGAESVPYNQAHAAAKQNDQPLVVLVGAEWCPGCRTMKQAVLPGLLRRGGMRRVQFSAVDTDADPALARQLMRGQSIPQLIVYYRDTQGWQRSQLVGARSEPEVQALINQAVAMQSKVTKVASNDDGTASETE